MGGPSKTVGKQKKPSFFKILFDDFSPGLQFPPAFTKKFGNQIPSTSKLEVKGYHEKSWEVEVEKIGEIYCFRKGWREFAEENNLEHWDFLVFKYLTDSKLFKVTIYGRTCCVKEFPVSREGNSEPLNGNCQKKVQDEGKRKWVQEDDDYDDSNIDQELKGTRMTKCELDGDKAYESHVIHVDSDSSEDENLGDFMRTRCNQRTNNKTLKRGGKSNGLPSHDDESRIEFNSQNPFFKVKLKHSEVVGRYLYIPQGFRKHLSNKEEQETKFQICEDIWRAHIVMVTNRGNKRTRNEFRIYSGWSNLLKDKGLKLGDVCIFEMIESENDDDDVVVFKVHVYRWDDEEAEFVKIW